MVGWTVAALVVVPLLVLGAVAVSLRDHVTELRRVQALASQRAQEAAGRLGGRAAALQRRLETLRARVPAGRAATPADSGRAPTLVGSGKPAART